MTLVEKYQNILKMTTYKLAKELDIQQSSLKRIKEKTVLPNLVNYRKMVNYFSKQEQLNFNVKEFLEDFFKEMATYRLAKELDIQQSSLKQIKERSILPNLVNYFKMVNYFSKQEQLNFYAKEFLENFFKEKK